MFYDISFGKMRAGTMMKVCQHVKFVTHKQAELFLELPLFSFAIN